MHYRKRQKDTRWYKDTLSKVGFANTFRDTVGSFVNFQSYFRQLSREIALFAEIAPGSQSPALFALAAERPVAIYLAYDTDETALQPIKKLSRDLGVKVVLFSGDAIETKINANANQLISFCHSIDDLFIYRQLALNRIKWHTWDWALYQYTALPPPSSHTVQSFIDELLNEVARDSWLVIQHFVRPVDHLICSNLQTKFDSGEFYQIRGWMQHYREEVAVERRL